MLESLEKMLAKGMDNPMLRFGLGKGYLDAGDPAQAATHLQRCVEQDPNYSAAWKLLGKALQTSGDRDGARRAWEQGVVAAQAHGDKQTEKEMGVFLRKLNKQADS
ncbi:MULTISPECIES: tetratricopeptide repeat protein [Pseudomonadaceae]|uniref:tetratricopeptide repeat protein n=1 Tax=Pseudomonadaceae TaxID=135621 RepID=UPI0015E2D99D|nr:MULTISPECIES: tetratricopeptide repeat protein [Pseudomonadaceae]MBA1276136.1 tetratricopeptide repeat protein [Stutzerimonas stutzeri]MBC8648646.1 tetratricopeptide repeat protein [Pseudomonas sp. MT4]QXY92630.1 tetratricopeptide repeat protein [Pseudomonas sp. MTM4]